MLLTLLFGLLVLAASLFSALVAHSFYKHKYPLTWPYFQDVVNQHWRSVQIYALQGWDLASVQVQLWTKEIVRVVQSLGAVKAKN
uniref:Putative secreted protein n=1 Tax=Amblyomma cajennense TaxID=34607 RepID=A0A023FPL6_AMBCJ